MRGSGSWKDVWLDEDYRWYAGDDTPNVPFYKDGREEPLRAEALTKTVYVDIYTGDKVGERDGYTTRPLRKRKPS